MTEVQGNGGTDERSVFTRPPFIIATVIVAIIALLGIYVAVQAGRNGNQVAPPHTPAPSTSGASTTPTPSPSSAGPEASVCGLSGVRMSGRISTAPEASWDYEGTFAYPASPTFGPAETAPESYRYCFQHSPEGALFATANALAQATNPEIVRPWVEYFLSAGGGRQRMLEELNKPSSPNATGLRLAIVGFKVLSYTGDAARVDVAVQGSGNGRTVVGSYVYELVWEGGDWKLNTAAAQPFDYATIPSTAGYIAWGA